MGENDARHGEARGPTRRRLCCTPFQNFSQRERDVEECHRRVGRVGPEYQSSRRGRGEQRRPLRRRVGNMGSCPPPLRGRSAVVARNAACTSGEPKIDSHVDFDLTGAWRRDASMPPSSQNRHARRSLARQRDRRRFGRQTALRPRSGGGHAPMLPTRRRSGRRCSLRPRRLL